MVKPPVRAYNEIIDRLQETLARLVQERTDSFEYTDAAPSYPLLWTAIEICFPDGLSSEARNMYPLSMMETRLPRSAQAPLDVTLDIDFDADPELLHTLSPAQYRARSTAQELPLLERIELGFYQDINEVFHAPSYFLATALKLRKVILTNLRLLRGSPLLVIRRPLITCYHGTYATRQQLEILRAGPQARDSCTGYNCVGSSYRASGSSRVIFPRLVGRDSGDRRTYPTVLT
ncbi:hypothetical protein DFH09DRAFT_1073028 [Mycena vulgaris]|nr:hypothetical protein DFH09DRAFT_1073028 [Mycena vulgaris]